MDAQKSSLLHPSLYAYAMPVRLKSRSSISKIAPTQDRKENPMSKGKTLDELSEKDWVAIKFEAIKVLKSKKVGKDEFRATIWGFVNWLLASDIMIEFEIELPKKDEKIH